MKTTQLLIISMLISLVSIGLEAQVNYYVKPAGSGNGSSWNNATTLSNALSVSASGDIIHLAAGEYIPSVKLTSGSDDLDMTFEIKNNISLIGGYPANPIVGDSPNAANQTLINGKIADGYNAYHAVVITAPVEAGKLVTLSNISITGGKSAASGTALTINTLTYPRTYGSGLIVGASNVQMNYCRIYENQGYQIPGAYIFGSANVIFNSCLIDNNSGTGNGGGIWNDASIVTVNNCIISRNQITGVGAGIYAVNSTKVSKTYMYNSSIINNIASNKTAYYGRENSEGVMVNCTVAGNTTTATTAANTGAGICLYTGTTGVATKAVKLDIINSTITNNSSVATGDLGGGIRVNDQYCTLNIYNSIVSGNTVGATGSKVVGDIALLNSATYTKKNTVMSDKIYDAFGTEISGQTFDFTTMLGELADNGGSSKTCQLLGASNPAKALGMNSSALISLGANQTPVIPESIIAYDQLGNSRTGNVIGAWTANKAISGVGVLKNNQKPVVYINDNELYIKSEINDQISVFNTLGKIIVIKNATSNLTRINNLMKGSIYIVNVNGQSTKVVL